MKPSSEHPIRNRRRLWLSAAVIVLLLAAAGITAGIIGQGGGGQPGAGETPTASGTPGASEPGPSAPDSSGEPSVPPSASPGVPPTVPIDEPADFGDGVVATVTAVTAVEATGQGVGEISGPALRFDISLVNGTSAPLDLSGVTVNLAYGAAQTPAAPLFGDASAVDFAGTLAVGGTAQAHYLFSVPTAEHATLLLSLSYAAGSPTVIFQR